MKTKGLLQILNVLGKLEEVKNDLISLRIVFVVPSRIEASYTLQQILTEAKVPSREELKDTFTIKGVGEKRKSTLEKKELLVTKLFTML
jgi:preprotein translocase subunit Sss1